MRAFALDELGKPGSVHEVPKPEPGPGQVRVHVEAGAANPMDCFVVAGYMKDRMEHHFPLIPGFDHAGTVDALGEGVTGFAVGDRVYGGLGKMIFGEGTFAEYTIASAGTIAKRPAGMDAATGAALPLAGLSALQAVEAVAPKKGDKIVVIGAAGGIGSYATQLLKAAGAHVIGVGRDANRDYVSSQGAAEFIDYEKGDPVEAILKSHPEGVDAIVATVGDKEALKPYLGLLHEGGRVSSMRGATDAEELGKRGIKGINIGTQITTAWLEKLAGLVEDGTLGTPEIERYPLDQAGEAIAALATGHGRGKKVVTP